MGRKKYFCDFCNRHFNDDKNTRMKHLNSVGHLNLKKEHYNMFRDPEIILKEESLKKPCRKFHYEGYCPFGGSCTFSHYSREDLNIIREEIKTKKKKLKELDEPSLDIWLQKYYSNLQLKKNKIYKMQSSCELPYEMLINSNLLPPSLLPFQIKEFLNAEFNSWA